MVGGSAAEENGIEGGASVMGELARAVSIWAIIILLLKMGGSGCLSPRALSLSGLRSITFIYCRRSCCWCCCFVSGCGVLTLVPAGSG